MSNEMPKRASPAQSKDDLIDDKKLQEIKLQNEISREIIESKNNQKRLDDTEAILHNAKILNRLSKFLVKIFFYKWFFLLWVLMYILLNICLYYHLGEKTSFYIALIDKIAIFIIVCILGKFLKDNLSLLIEMFKK